MEQFITRQFEESLKVKAASLDHIKKPLSQAIQACIECIRNGGTLFWAGNGGSAADAQHMAAELIGRFKKERKAIRSVALTTNTSSLTAIGNDYSYDRVFERQLEAFAEPRDILIAISTSGNSESIVKVLAFAQKARMKTIGLTGMGGARCAPHCDILIDIPSRETARIQECHLLIEHILCEAIEAEY